MALLFPPSVLEDWMPEALRQGGDLTSGELYPREQETGAQGAIAPVRELPLGPILGIPFSLPWPDHGPLVSPFVKGEGEMGWLVVEAVPLAITVAEGFHFTGLYVFGDSLSDNGNLNAAVEVAGSALQPILGIDVSRILEPPIYNERFTNELTWVEYLTQDLNLAPLDASGNLAVFNPLLDFDSPITFDPTPQFSPYFEGTTTGRNVNFAVAAAETGASNGAFPGLLTQVGWLTEDLAWVDRAADGEALYVIWGGANDYFGSDPLNFPAPQDVVANLTQGIVELYGAGARNFLVANLPDLGVTPPGPLGGGDPATLTALSLAHNAQLAIALEDLADLPGINLVPLDIFTQLNLVRDDALNNGGATYGITNVTESCLNFATQTLCGDPDTYLFWDNVHPTAAGHQLLGQFALDTLENFDFEPLAPSPQRFFQEGVKGYVGTQDTWVGQAAPSTSNGDRPLLVVDNDTINSLTVDRPGQTLLRFDQIFGDEATGKIPLGATITEARLRLNLEERITIPFVDPNFQVYFMTRSWTETSTWNSLGSGLSLGNDYDALIGSFSGANILNGNDFRFVDVRSAVQRWSDGEPNNGLAILSAGLLSNDAGISLTSSEGTEIAFRPALEVTYTLGASSALALGTLTPTLL